MHQAGEELLDALRVRLGWRPLVTSFEAALPRWAWRLLRPVLATRVIALGRVWYVGSPTRLLEAAVCLPLIAHEGVHALARRSLMFYPLYFLQQVLVLLVVGTVAVASARGMLSAWVPVVVAGALAIPWPAPHRAWFEADAYAASVHGARYFGADRAEAIDKAVTSMAHWSYWMTPWPLQTALRRAYRGMVLRALWDPRGLLTGWTHDIHQVATAWGHTVIEAPHD